MLWRDVMELEDGQILLKCELLGSYAACMHALQVCLIVVNM